jgi:hypothetical protein
MLVASPSSLFFFWTINGDFLAKLHLLISHPAPLQPWQLCMHRFIHRKMLNSQGPQPQIHVG